MKLEPKKQLTSFAHDIPNDAIINIQPTVALRTAIRYVKPKDAIIITISYGSFRYSHSVIGYRDYIIPSKRVEWLDKVLSELKEEAINDFLEGPPDEIYEV